MNPGHFDVAPLSIVQTAVYATNLLIWLAIWWYFRSHSKHYVMGKKISRLFIAVMWTSGVFFTTLLAMHYTHEILTEGQKLALSDWIWVTAYIPAQLAGISLIYTLYRGDNE